MSILQSLTIQRRVMYALLMREVITRFGRQNLGVLWIFLEPMIFTAGVAALWKLVRLDHGSSLPIVAFAITGYSSVLLWRNCANHSLGALATNAALLHHRNVRPIDVFLTRSVLEIVGATASLAVLSGLCIMLGWMSAPVDALKVVFGWSMLAWFGVALAFVVGAGTAFSSLVMRVWQPISYLMFPLSGAAFMVDWLPTDFREFVLYLPMVHGVELLREGYFGNVVRTHHDMGYMAACCLAMTFLGLFLVREAGLRVGSK